VTFNHGVEGSSPSALTMSNFAPCFRKRISAIWLTGNQGSPLDVRCLIKVAMPSRAIRA
jgi:hypothetical protein